MRKAGLTIIAASLVLSGCATQTDYRPPAFELKNDAWSSEWQVATPADDRPRGPWWEAFNDPDMNALQQRIDTDNLTLASALSRFNQANALADQARAQQLPTVDVAASVLRNRQSDDRPLRGATQPALYGANTIGAVATYEIDLWGRVKNWVAANAAQAQVAAAEMETLRLSLHALLADHYVALRGVDAQLRLFEKTIDNYQRALLLTKNRYEGGIASGLDVSRAETQLSLARAQLAELGAQRALHLHAIAVLVGEPPQTFQLPSHEVMVNLPDVPVGIPSTLLQRRPDVAAAERKMAAAHARVGVARTAFFPTFSLGLQAGFQSTGGGSWLTAPNSFWTWGPMTVFNLFDGGARKAQVAQAVATLDQASADYRSTVLTAYQQVEDEMAKLRNYGAGMNDLTQATVSAERASSLALSRYRDGAVTYLDVINAQTVFLQSQRDLLTLQTKRLSSGIGLVRALGGGWNAP